MSDGPPPEEVVPDLDDLERRARERLHPDVFEYVRQGSGDEVTLGRAVAAWRDVRLVPRVLVDVAGVDPGVEVLGRWLDVAWGVAPTTLQVAVHPDGDVAMAEATRDAGSLLVVSSNTGTAVEDIGATGVRWWLQLYLPRDRDLARPLLERAAAAGAEAVVLTVDTPVVSTKHPAGARVWAGLPAGAVRANFPDGYDDAPGSEKAADLGPNDLAWLSEVSGLPVVAKGVLRADDATRCVADGAAAVWVSNHGGRQLDRAVETASALPAVVAAVGDRAEVYVDGGLRRGLDVVTALALGARTCFLGRSPLYALADGRDGVTQFHTSLRSEVEEAMRLAGAPTAADLPGLAAFSGSPTPGDPTRFGVHPSVL